MQLVLGQLPYEHLHVDLTQLIEVRIHGMYRTDTLYRLAYMALQAALASYFGAAQLGNKLVQR